jgi:NADP-reducing hydrogenase subunit HndD
MAAITINGLKVNVSDDATILEAAKSAGINIPTLCNMQDVSSFGSCRICVVEVEGAKTLQVSCLTKVRDGMVVRTNTGKVRKARRVLYELLLSDHDQECLTCSRNGSCELQALGETLGIKETRFKGAHDSPPEDVSVSITRDMGKCILCRRCVAACNNIQNTGVLNAQNRGFDTVIAPAMQSPLGDASCVFCGQCTVVCPTGALHETDSTKKVWDMLDSGKRTVVQVAPCHPRGHRRGVRAAARIAGHRQAGRRAQSAWLYRRV